MHTSLTLLELFLRSELSEYRSIACSGSFRALFKVSDGLSVVLLKVLHDSLTEVQLLEAQIDSCLVEK